MDERRLAILFQKYLTKTTTPAEKQEFFRLVTQPGADKLLRKYGELYDIDETVWTLLDDEASTRVLTNIFNLAAAEEHKPEHESGGDLAAGQLPSASDERDAAPTVMDTDAFSERSWRQRHSWKLAAAAVVLLAVCLGYLYKTLDNGRGNTDKLRIAGNQILQDVQPGHGGALLTLASGQSYLLDTMANGQVTTGILKSSDQLQLKDADVENALLKTPMGRQQLLVLSDGTRVWLNAGSSIEFPTKFSGAKRSVVITGEAYFEVVHNEKQPFEVRAGNQVIHDLGTHFNVNAYDNEAAMKVTLQEGSVQVGDRVVLKPGEAFSEGKVSKVNAEDAIAWVSGYFHFEHADIESVMRQLSRWYNVEVTYEGRIPPLEFGGDIQKSLNLSAVLELLAETGIHYSLNGKQLIIRP